MSSMYLSSTIFGSMSGTFPSMTSLTLTTLVGKTITDAFILTFFPSSAHRRLHFPAYLWMRVAMHKVLTFGQGREVVCATARPKHSDANGDPLLCPVMEI